jgi:AmmeMemoRadiSam system protein B
MDKPKLRNLQALSTEINGKKVLVFQDPERISPEAVMVPAELAPIIRYFDGNHTIRDIQAKLMRTTGELIDSEQIQRIVNELDKYLLLESEHLFQHLKEISTAWEKADVRPPALAGTAYPESAEELRGLLHGFYTDPAGPGLPDPASANDLKGILSPHIDLKGNGPCYAHAYKTLAERSEAETFFIIGTAHFEAMQTFIFCEKDFATPLGIAETDREFIQLVKRRLKDRSKKTDLTHRLEHSIEFQVIFLQHLFAGKKNLRIIPLLVGSFQHLILSQSSPHEDPLVRDFIEVVRTALSEQEKQVCFITGGDLAHLGPRYGDRELYAPIREPDIKADDQKMIEPLLGADEDAFFQAVAEIQDRRHVCGLSPLYTMLAIIKPERGELLKWSCWFDQATRSAVSFASMAFY